jgi:hypothetical protein
MQAKKNSFSSSKGKEFHCRIVSLHLLQAKNDRPTIVGIGSAVHFSRGQEAQNDLEPKCHFTFSNTVFTFSDRNLQMASLMREKKQF